MTLLVLAEQTDETAARFAEFAESQGIETVLADGFDRIEITVHVGRDRRYGSTVLVDGRPTTGVFCRGRVSTATQDSPTQNSAAARFAADERYAALWSALALWPGPVINRPSEHGYPPRLDPLELAAALPGTRPAGTITNGHDVPGDYAYRLTDWEVVDPSALAAHDVVHVTEVTETLVQRLVFAGARSFPIAGSGQEPDLTPHAAHIDQIRQWLQAKHVDFAVLTIGLSGASDSGFRVFEASTWAHHSQFESVEEQVYTALLEKLRR